MNWIKTTDELPPLDFHVIVTRKHKDNRWEIGVAFVFERYEELWWESNDRHYYLSRFTHWLHLPPYPLDQKSIL